MKPKLVLLHGWGMHGGIWGEFAERLAVHFELLCLDLPGYGGSDPCALHDLAGVTQAMLALMPPRAHVLGWSMGGLVAMHIAANAPERVERLVLIGSSPRFCQDEGWKDAMAPGVLDAFEAQIRGNPQATLHRFLAVQSMGGDDARAQTVLLKRFLAERPLPTDDTLRAGLGILRHGDVRPLLPDVLQPVSLIYGEQDTVVPAGAGRYLARHLRNARLHTLAGCAHAPFLTRADEVAGLVREFLQESEA